MSEMPDWRCVDPVLCSYEMEIGGKTFKGQRTFLDTVAVWLDGEKIAARPTLDEARRFVLAHAGIHTESTDERPANCRNKLRDEGKAYPRSGCLACRDGGLRGCPYERAALKP